MHMIWYYVMWYNLIIYKTLTIYKAVVNSFIYKWNKHISARARPTSSPVKRIDISIAQFIHRNTISLIYIHLITFRHKRSSLSYHIFVSSPDDDADLHRFAQIWFHVGLRRRAPFLVCCFAVSNSNATPRESNERRYYMSQTSVGTNVTANMVANMELYLT